MASSKGYSLKDQLFNLEKVRYLGGLFYDTNPSFDKDGFVDTIMQTLLDLELKARINLIAEVLAQYLSKDFQTAALQIQTALPPELDPSNTDDDFGDFIFAPLGEYVVKNGLDDLDTSLPLLKEITKRFSMEFALRHFLISAPNETMATLLLWALDENYHVRRLVSEGTRPTLPWGLNVGLKVGDTLPLLENLHTDHTRFVTRSVSNHLNDLSKKSPTVVIGALISWREASIQDKTELDWMTRHALRTLVKKGNGDALVLLGYNNQPNIKVSDVSISVTSLPIGDATSFSATITAEKDENLMIDYVIDFVKANGKTSPKVFKLKKVALKRGQSVTLNKTHKFLKGATTFTHYPGVHRMYLQVNGKRHGCCEFELT